MKLWIMCGIMLGAASLMAETEKVGDYTWRYYKAGDSVGIGAGRNATGPAVSPSPVGDITIPSVLGNKPVTSIGGGAFVNGRGLRRVTIPDGVTSIGNMAFVSCSGLTSVTIPNSVTNIGRQAFSNCDSLKSLTIPNSVASIGDMAFGNCRGLTSLTIPNSVKSFGKSAFSGCRLTGVAIPNDVTYIGGGAFSGCRELKSFAIADDNPNYKFKKGLILTKDGTTLVSGVGSLTNADVLIPNGVKNIADSAFSDSDLARVMIPNSVTSIGGSAFAGCWRLKGITIPNSVTSIGQYAFKLCDGISSVAIPSSVTNIVSPAFGRKLKSFDVAEDNPCYKSVYGLLLTKDGSTLVEVPHALEDVKIPDGVASIGRSAFSECFALKRLTIPNSVTSIEGMFWNGMHIMSITFKGNAPRVEQSTFLHVPANCTVYVNKDSSGWGVDIPGKWKGLSIKYIEGAPAPVPDPVKPESPKNATGPLDKNTLSVTVDAQDLSMFSGRVIADLLPRGEKASVVGGRWKFANAAIVKWARPKKGEPLPDIYDERTGLGLVVDNANGKTNLSGLTLLYSQASSRRGTFSGSFKVYELQGAGARTMLKVHTVRVSGAVVDGVGKGRATCMKPQLNWPVVVELAEKPQ